MGIVWMLLLNSLCWSQVQRTQPPPEEEDADAEEEETEELGHVDTYAEYRPSKCRLLDWMSTSCYKWLRANLTFMWLIWNRYIVVR